MITTTERFFKYITPSVSGCWDWSSYFYKDGYGNFYAYKKSWRAHRFAYELLIGKIPKGLDIDHLCRNRGCVNPDHLDPVTKLENWRRGKAITVNYSQNTHCKNGHLYNIENTIRGFSKNGRKRRNCKACCRIAARNYQRRKRETTKQ